MFVPYGSFRHRERMQPFDHAATERMGEEGLEPRGSIGKFPAAPLPTKVGERHRRNRARQNSHKCHILVFIRVFSKRRGAGAFQRTRPSDRPMDLMKLRPAPLIASAALAAALVGAACTTTVPETGRRQFNMLPPAQEAALGLSEFQKMKQTMKISTDPGQNALVQRVGSRLSKVMPVPEAEWEFVVFDEPSPNAFALPGGKVGVHSGLFQVTRNEAGLAAVIGHEVAHVVARHSGERATQTALAGVAAAGAGYVLNRDGRNGALPTAAVGAGALLMTKKWSREQELEADRMGAIFMARAGYDPREAVELWKRFADWKQRNSQGGGGPNFLSTHPLDEKRIEQLQHYLPEALAEYKR